MMQPALRLVLTLLLVFATASIWGGADSAAAPTPSTAEISGPFQPGMNGVTTPSLIPGTKYSPKMPKQARRDKVEGNVILRAVVNKIGLVVDLEVTYSSNTDYGFEKVAKRAVKKWRYKPATKDGEPVAVYFPVHVHFTLD